jgi:hypothetical protein
MAAELNAAKPNAAELNAAELNAASTEGWPRKKGKPVLDSGFRRRGMT